MKYTRLTKEQFEALQEEFTRFLATQSITADEWKKLKEEKPQLAEAELDLFSDLVWEGALSAAHFLENASKDQIFSFAVKDDRMELIHLKVVGGAIDLNTAEGRQWLLENLKDDSIQIQTGSKPFTAARNTELFSLIRQGAQIVDESFYSALQKYLNS